MTRFIGSTRCAVLAASALATATFGAVVTPLAPSAFAQEAINVERLSNGAPLSFADLIDQVSPAVVSINVTTTVESPFGGEEFNFDGAPDGFEDFFRQFRREFGEGDEPREARALGSGFVISSDGYVVTNNHVVDGATEVSVVLRGGDELEAEIVGTDESTDLALLKIERDEAFPFVEFATGEAPRVGDWVVAVGNPFGLGGTATAGIVSASGREIGGRYNDFLQIDAPINRGNSGGPTFDLDGKVVGVNSQIFSPSGGSVGIGFAIPADTASRVVGALIQDGRVVRGWLGVTIESVTADIAESLGLDEALGAIVNNVVAGGPAEDAGFEVGDVVLEVNGETVENNLDLTRKVGDLVVGERVRFHIFRGDRERNLTVTIGERPGEQELASLGDGGPSTDAPSTGTAFGMALVRPDEETQRRLGLGPNEGLMIADIERTGEAASKGLSAGDVILEVAGETVSTSDQFSQAVDQARDNGRSAVLLLVQNDEVRRFVALSLTANG